MKLISQPIRSNLCGQACVAMIADVSLDKSIMAFGGKKGKTRTKELVLALSILGVSSGSRLLRISRGVTLPPTCIVHVIWKSSKDGKTGGHWIVYHHGEYYDPANDELLSVYPQEWGKLVSFLEIMVKEGN